MPKHDLMSPKGIANRIKAKGLQKLRWYCQMCNKQCRDANGFKCHTESESHQRNILLFAEKPAKFIEKFSSEFESGMMSIISCNYRSMRVLANVVYNDYIKDRNHVHMNSTKWTTLSGFVMYLGKTGRCKVEETAKGWYITYIEKDPLLLERQAKAERKERMEIDDLEREKMEIERRIESAKLASGESLAPSNISLNSSAPIKFTFKTPAVNAIKPIITNNNDEKEKSIITNTNNSSDHQTLSFSSSTTMDKKSSSSWDEKESHSHVSNQLPPKKLTAAEELMIEEEAKKERRNRKDYWLHIGIVVKIMNKSLKDGKYYKQKGVVKQVEDRYVGHIQLLDSEDLLKLDQDQLETVIPPLGGLLLIVNGAYRGEQAILLSIEESSFRSQVRIETGPFTGKTISLPYEDISKVHVAK
eukprot:TRINITY_DN4132_c0_g1_i1.p1 TRINITY_DN4132_c0_g1~~TRINITY_DN4132_c0_g1_i1.p1  ORF type:complete len:415 (-),score=141.75 TRINITY_DN4132_c0_g1_i1:21-1265(-)